GSLAGSQPAWMSVDVKSLDGWAGTAGDYTASYRELAGVDQNRIRGLSWRKQRDDGSVLAIAAGLPQTGSVVTNDNTASVPEFGGFVGGVRLTSAKQDQDIGVAVAVSDGGDHGRLVVGGQKDFQIEDRETGLQSAYVSADLGAFQGNANSVDVRARAALAYALNPQVGLRANASYDGASFQTSPASNEGVFDQRVGARTSLSAGANWRADAPIGGIHYLSAGLNGSWTQSGADASSSTTVLATLSGQIGERGPRINVAVSQQSSDASEDKQTVRVRAFQSFDWASVTANYTQTTSDGNDIQQFTANVQTKPYNKRWSNGARVSLAPSLGVNWNGDDTQVQAGVSAVADSGQAFGERFSVLGRYSALSDFASEQQGLRHFANLQARYRITDRIELITIYSDDFDGNSDVSVGLRGVMSFNPPRRHTKPNDGAGVLTGRVFLDENRDGIRQAHEPGVPGVRIMIGRGLGLNTAYEGEFTIQNLKAGLYPVNVDKRSLPLGYLVSEENLPRVTIGEGRRTDVDVPLILSGQVRGSLFVDDNADGDISAGEKRLEGVWVRLIRKSGGEPRVTHSASFGQFGFENVLPGDYTLEANVAGQTVTKDVSVSDEAPFVKTKVPVPPDLLSTGGGIDLSAGVIGEP
ncbi:MAG: SdrD B-like domain-containing protein, partial [Pseudomonadota bacterium]